MGESDKLEEKEVILESMAVDPFRGWSDWSGTEGEAVVTFETMEHNLWNSWTNQCVKIKKYNEKGEEIKPEDFEDVQEYFKASNNAEETERVVEPEKFEYRKVEEPGIYRDGTYYDEEDSVDEGYTIIVPYSFLTPEICRKYVRKLNEKFNRQFSLKIREEQKPPISNLRRTKAEIRSREKLDQNIKKELQELIKEVTED